MLEHIRRDLILALRLLRRSPLFTLTASASLAVGIGADTAIFAVANSLLFRPPDGIVAPEALVDIGAARGDGGLNPMPFSTYSAIASRATGFSGVYAQQMFPHVLSLTTAESARAEGASALHVTTNFFKVLGTRPAIGRLFSDADDESVAVLDQRFWAKRFQSDPSVLGRVLRLNGKPVTIVGVAAQGFQGTGLQTIDLWLVDRADAQGVVLAGGRLRDGVSVAAAAAEVTAIGEAVDREHSGSDRRRLGVLPFSRVGGNRNVVAGFASMLLLLVSLVLAVACANVASLLLSRSTARQREMAVRLALGAGRVRLVQQLLTETVVLFAIGGLMGLVLARALVSLIPLLPGLPASTIVPAEFDRSVLGFITSISFVTAVVTGLTPAFSASRTAPFPAIKGGTSGPPRASRLRSALVIGEVAMSLLLVVLAGLLVRTLRYAGATSPGFDAHRVELATVNLTMLDIDASRWAPLWQTTIEGVRRLPSVETASLARVPPGGWEGIGLGSVSKADAAAAVDDYAPAWNIVDSGYFATLGIPLLSGRDFSADDSVGTPPVVIVGDRVAQHFWPHERALGRSVALSAFNPRTRRTERRLATVIGVASDIKTSSVIDGIAESYVYLPLRQQDDMRMTSTMSIVARSRDGRPLAAELDGAVRAVDPGLVVVRAQTLGQAVALGLTPQRLLAGVAGSLGLLGLLLASLGIYGVTAYTAGLRHQEFGIRMALGARPRAITWMVVRQGILLIAIGAVIGLGLAAGAAQVLSIFLYGLPPIHPPTFAGAAVLFITLGAIASYLPARRAISIDASRALRDE